MGDEWPYDMGLLVGIAVLNRVVEVVEQSQ